MYFSIAKLLHFNLIHGTLDVSEPMETLIGNQDVLFYLLNKVPENDINNSKLLAKELHLYLEYYV